MPEGLLVADAGATLRELVAGPVRRARVVGAFATAVYLAPEDRRIIGVEALDGIGLPNALRLRRPASGLELATVTPDVPASVGDGRVRIGGLTVTVDQWVDHTYRPAGVDVTVLRDRLEQLDAALVGGPLPDGLIGPLGELRAALHGPPDGALADAARGLVGLGEGLTPSGDDILCGLLSAGRTLAAPLGAHAARARLDRVAAAVLRDAAQRTTALSAALLWHADRGELAEPARGLARALLGRTRLAPALDALLSVGHSSGRDLALGMALGVRTVLRSVRHLTTTSGVRL